MPGNNHRSPTEPPLPVLSPAAGGLDVHLGILDGAATVLSGQTATVQLIHRCPATALVEREEQTAPADQRARRAGRRVPPERQRPQRTSGLLIGLGRDHPDVQPVRRVHRHIVEVQGDEFAAPVGAGESHQQQGGVAVGGHRVRPHPERRRQSCQDGADIGQEQWATPFRWCPPQPANPGQGPPDDFRAAGRG